MKVRHLKARAIAAHLGLIWSNAYWQREIDRMMQPTPADIARDKAEREAFWAKLKSDLNIFSETRPAVAVVAEFLTRTAEESHALFSAEEVEAAKIEFVVAKVSNDEVVGSFDLREDAVALINKHHKQKKAKLYLLGGEPMHCTEHDVG